MEAFQITLISIFHLGFHFVLTVITPVDFLILSLTETFVLEYGFPICVPPQSYIDRGAAAGPGCGPGLSECEHVLGRAVRIWDTLPTDRLQQKRRQSKIETPPQGAIDDNHKVKNSKL
jgi:hypothetical protein